MRASDPLRGRGPSPDPLPSKRRCCFCTHAPHVPTTEAWLERLARAASTLSRIPSRYAHIASGLVGPTGTWLYCLSRVGSGAVRSCVRRVAGGSLQTWSLPTPREQPLPKTIVLVGEEYSGLRAKSAGTWQGVCPMGPSGSNTDGWIAPFGADPFREHGDYGVPAYNQTDTWVDRRVQVSAFPMRSDSCQPTPLSRSRTGASGAGNLVNGVEGLGTRRGTVHPVPKAFDCVPGYIKRTIHRCLQSNCLMQSVRGHARISMFIKGVS